MKQYLGLLESKGVYSTTLVCDRRPIVCWRQIIDIDQRIVEEQGEGVCATYVQEFMQENGWVTVTAEDGSERHYCAEHAVKP